MEKTNSNSSPFFKLLIGQHSKIDSVRSVQDRVTEKIKEPNVIGANCGGRGAHKNGLEDLLRKKGLRRIKIGEN